MDNLPVNPLDIVVAAILVISGFFAYMRGFVHEVLAVGGWVGAIFATIYGFPHAQPIARKFIAVEWAADLAAGAALFVMSMVVLSILTRMISRRVQDSALNVVDRSLGFVFGLARGAFLVCIAYIGVSWIWAPNEQPAWMQTARSAPFIAAGGNYLRSIVPQETARRATTAAQEAEQRARSAAEAERLLRSLVRPSTEAGTAREEPAYDRRQRQGLERLIEDAK